MNTDNRNFIVTATLTAVSVAGIMAWNGYIQKSPTQTDAIFSEPIYIGEVQPREILVPIPVPEPLDSDTAEADLDCLTRNIYFESRGEPYKGKVAVAQVTMNRVRESNKTVCDVVYAPSQFSWTSDKRKHNYYGTNQAWAESAKIALEVYTNGYPVDLVEGATYFHADYVNPNWGFTKVAQYGAHIFYKE